MLRELTNTQRWVLIAVCANIGMVLGLMVNVSGLFFGPIMQELHTSTGQVSTTVAIYNLLFAIGGLFFPRVMKGLPYKKLYLFSLIIIVCCTAGLAFCHSIWTLYLLNAFRGFFAGFLGPVASTMIVNRWFKERTGFFSGLVFALSGVVGAIFSPIITYIITHYSWRTAYLFSAGVCILFSLPSLLSKLAYTPEEVGELPFGKESEVVEAINEDRPIDTKLFALMFIFPIAIGFTVSFVQHFSGLADSYGLVTEVSSLMLSLVMVMNTAGKFILGILIDRIGTKRGTFAFLGLDLCAVLFFLFLRIPMGMYIASFLFGTTYALGNISLVSLAKDLFGTENYGKTYSKLSASNTFTTAIGASLIGFMFDWFHTYTYTLVVMGISLVMCFFVVSYAFKKTKKA